MKKRSWLPLVLTTLVLALALLWGCSDDDGPANPPAGGGEEDAFGTISGVVFAAGGMPLAEAVVSAGEVTTTSNEDGYFVLTSVPEGNAVVGFASSGYSSTFRSVTVLEGGSTHLQGIVLVPLESYVVDGAAGGSVATTDGSGQVDFAADSFVDSAGNPYTGDVTVQVNAMQPEDADFFGSFPGDFSGVREGGTVVPFVSFGYMTVELTGADKAPLRMAPGATATLSLTLAADKVLTAPASIPMWYFDEADGLWHEDGAATLVGSDYVADVTHFTTWNWDLPVDDICSITGTVVNEAGQPVNGARVISRNGEMAIMDEVFTDAAGLFTVRALRNSASQVWAVSGSLASDPAYATVGDVCPFVLTDPLVLTVPAYAISLTWDEFPDDLDSHLLVPMTWNTDYDYYHIYYSSMGTLGADPYAVLDTDDTSSYGPEIITGTRLYQGRFQYWINNYETDDTADLAASGAVVQLELGGRLYLYDVADVPLAGADQTGWWHVFDFVVDGAAVAVDPVMRFQPRFSDEGLYFGYDKNSAKDAAKK